MITPKDQHVREQILRDQNNQVITASAGSGKTTLIVQKYLKLIKEGIDPKRIVAITFTNQSAHDLTKRIYQAHRKEFPDEPPLPVASLPISTIHRFCSQLISPYSFDFGLMPGFDVDQDHIRENIEILYQKHLPELVATFDDFHLWKLLGYISFSSIYQWLCNLSYDGISIGTKTSLTHFDPYSYTLRMDLNPLKQNCVEEGDRLLTYIDQLSSIVLSYTPEDTSTWMPILSFTPKSLTRLGNAKNWGGKQTLEEIRAAVQKVHDLLLDFRNQLAQHIFYELGVLQDHLQKLRIQDKQTKQYLEPDDLLDHARTLLRKDASWRDLVKRYDYFFIDEFQDTDPVQTEIMFRLCAQTFPTTHDLHQIKLRPHCMTLVGDPQQSIYRFRNASVETFYEAMNHVIQCGGQQYTISQNFRSDSSVVSFVNERFSKMAHFTPMLALEEQRQGNVHILSTETTTDKMGLTELRKLEATLLCRGLQTLIQKNSALSYSDIVLLLPTFSHADLYEQTISEHFPIMKARKTNTPDPFFQSIITLLSFLAQPDDAYGKLAVLRTPFLFHSLVKLHGFDEETFDLSASGRLLQDMIQRYQQSPYYFFESFAATLRSVISSSSEDLLRLQILDFCLQEILRWETSSSSSITLIDELYQRYEKTFVPDFGQENTIRIMTMHQTKGLEYKVVALGGLYQQALSPQSLYQDPRNKRAGISLAPFQDWLQSEDFDALKESEKKAQLEEKQRLFYVACTRAKAHLLVTRLPMQSRQKTYADLLWDA